MTRTEAKTSSRRGRGTAPLYALAAPLALIVATATPGEALAAGLPSQLSSPLGAPGATVPDPLPMTALVKAIGASNRIDGLTVEELDDGTTVLHLKGSTKPTFNVYRLGEPDRLVVDLASAERGKVVPFAPLDTWACGRVSIDSVVERDAELVRVVIELKRDASYVVVPKDGTLVVTITPRQIAPEAYFARKTAGKRQLELQAKEKELAAAERTAKALGIEAKLINTKAKKREQAAEKLAATARKRSAEAKKVESAALAAEKRALEAEKKAGDTLADAKSHRFRARRALKQAKTEREQAEKARADAQAERKAADAARDTANAELRLAKAALDEERDKLIVARQRAEKAEARALVAKGQAESEKKEATKAKLRAQKAEAAAKTAQASAEKKLATARAELARAKAAASRAEADAKSKLAKAERAAAAAEKASSSADKAAAKKLAAAAEQANKELEKARSKVTTAETKAATKLAAAEKAEREAKALLASARTKAKLEAAKVLRDADAKRAKAAKVLEDADAERAKVAKQAKAEAAKLLADAGTKKSRAAALEKKAKQALSRAETAVAEAEAERTAAAKARKEATAALAAAKTKAAAANASERAKAQREVETAQNAQKVARARYKQTEDAVAKLRKDRDSLKTKLAAQKKLSSDLEAKIKTRQSELKKLERKVADAKLAARKASSAAKAAEAATAAEVAKAAELAKATAAAKAKATKAKSKPTKPAKPSPKLVAAEKALAQARVTATVLEKEVGRLRKDATAAESRARQAENKVASLKKAGAAAAELDEARAAAKQAKAEAGSASVLLAKRKRKLDTVEKTLSEKRTAVARLQDKHDALTKQNEAAAKALTATQSKHAALSKKNADAAKELTATQSKHAVLSKKTAAAAKELTATQSEYAALSKKNAAAAEALSAKQNKHAALARKNEAATRELNAAQAELEQLRASLSAERSELRALTEDVENARASLDVRMAEAAEAEAAKKRALTEAEELERKNEQARDQATKIALAEKTKKAKQARVKDIRFEHDAKEQRVIVSVDGPMRFEGQSLTPTIKMLALDDAKLATKLERSLDASSYSGNIKTITSFAEGDATKVLVSTHGPSKARVEERAGELVWHFPTGPKRRKPASDGPEVVSMAGSKVAGYATGPGPAKPIAAIPTTRMAAMAPPTNPGSGSRIPGTSGGSSQANVQPATRRRTRWRGERIDIELQDAPIKDVLLLFADIGRVNIIAGNGVDGQVTMKLKAVPWDQALDTILRSLELGSTREGNVIRVATVEDLEAERKAAIDRANARVQLKPIETRIVPVSYATVDEMIPKVQNVLSPRGSVTPDTRTNQLVIMDVADNIAVAELLVNSLDTQTPQVLIEARIVEARTSFTRNLGIQWGFDFTASPGTGNPTGLLFPNSLGVGGGATGQPPDVRGLILPGAAANPNYAVDLPAPVGTGQGGALGFSFGSISGNLNTNLRLSAAESTGEVRIISAPKVVTLDNNEAQIETGVQIPISQVSAQGVNTRFVNATLSLRVTPQVTNEGAVLLDVQVQKNEADFVNTGARGDPTILTNQAQSRLLVNDADTAVIGGIYTRNKAVNFTKIPWLADIPIIGWFFKNKSEADTRSEILIFLTPKIVNRASSIGG